MTARLSSEADETAISGNKLYFRLMCKEARLNLAAAKRQEEDVLRRSHEAGFTYSEISRWLGLTPQAIRLRFKRRGW